MNPSGSPFPPPNVPGAPSANAETDGKAVASLILGILALTILSILAGIPAVILGHVSRSNIKKSMGRLKGEGMALAGLIMGYLSLLIIPFILIIAAIAIPNLLRSRISANEAGAVGAVRTINTAAITYLSRNEERGYPTELKQLAGSGEDGLITAELAEGSRNGYQFVYTAMDDDGNQVPEGYFVVATPITPGSTGVRSFCGDQTGVIRSAGRGETCTATSDPL
ncbi:MAG: DUF4190 domain-containing protein [Terriglobales bacterium]